MRYKADYLTVVVREAASQAIILSDTEAKSRSLAMRHARALLEVYRAGRALVRAQRCVDALDDVSRNAPYKGRKDLTVGMVAETAEMAAGERLRAAVAKLEAVEKEVRRG